MRTTLPSLPGASRQPGSDFQRPGTRRWYPTTSSHSSPQSRISRPETPYDDGISPEPGSVIAPYVFGSTAGLRADFVARHSPETGSVIAAAGLRADLHFGSRHEGGGRHSPASTADYADFSDGPTGLGT